MLKNEKLILEKISQKVSDCQWAGWEKGSCSLNSPYFEYEAGKQVYIIGLRTILPDSLLKLEIRFYFTGPWRVTKFDPEKHKEYMYDLRLIDDLARFDERMVFQINLYSDEKEIELLAEIFEKAKKKARFIDRTKKRRRMHGKLLRIM